MSTTTSSEYDVLEKIGKVPRDLKAFSGIPLPPHPLPQFLIFRCTNLISLQDMARLVLSAG